MAAERTARVTSSLIPTGCGLIQRPHIEVVTISRLSSSSHDLLPSVTSD